MVVDGVEDFVETLGDLVKVLQRQLAVVQLAVGKNLVDQVLHQPLNP